MKKIASFIIFGLLFVGPLRAEEPEGPILHSLSVKGNSAIKTEKIISFVPLKVEKPFDEKKVRLTGQMLLSLYSNEGYLGSTVNIRSGASALDLVIDIQEGERYTFGPTIITGLTSLPNSVVKHQLDYKEGDPYSREKLLRTQTRLYLTGLLESVRIQATTTTARVAEISIDVKQKDLKWIKGGVGWGSEEQERFTLMLNHKNVWRWAHEIEVMGTVSRIWQEYKADYIDHYLFDTRTEARGTVSWRGEDRDGYDYERILGAVSLGRELHYDVLGSIAYQYQRNTTLHVEQELAPITPDSSDGRSFVLTLNRDKTNDPFYPTRGTRSQLVLQRSGGFLGGTVNFNKAALTLRGFHRIVGPFTGALAVRSGVVREFNPSAEVPIFDRFFTGGGNSVRGYRERGVGPKDSSGSPLGGEWMLSSTFEIRFPLFWKLNGAIFTDGGQVGQEHGDVDVSRWKTSAGGGIRFVTPVGPIRLDYGYKLNRDADDNDPWRIHFSLGESF
jgi:outer membrane protein assembly complex protein YaeT